MRFLTSAVFLFFRSFAIVGLRPNLYLTSNWFIIFKLIKSCECLPKNSVYVYAKTFVFRASVCFASVLRLIALAFASLFKLDFVPVF